MVSPDTRCLHFPKVPNGAPDTPCSQGSGSANHRTPPMRYPCGANCTAIVMHNWASCYCDDQIKVDFDGNMEPAKHVPIAEDQSRYLQYMVQTICVPYITHWHCRCSWITHHCLTVEHVHSLILLFHLVPVSVLISLVLIVFCVLCLFFDSYSFKKADKKSTQKCYISHLDQKAPDLS